MGRTKSTKRRRLPLQEVPTIALDDLLVEGHLGAIKPGVQRREVLAALGPPAAHSNGMPVARATIWVYGKLCHGHLELHFLEDDTLWMVFCDYLPVRRIRTATFRLDPGCLGGLVTPPIAEVMDVLARRGVHAAISPRDARWADPPPSHNARRIPVRQWNKVCRAVDRASIESSFHSEVRLPSGIILGVGSEIAMLPSGEQVAREDAVIVMSV